MPSAFDLAWSGASPAIDRVFGTPFLYEPMTPNPQGGRPIPDPSRQTLPIVGALGEDPMFGYPETTRGKGSVVAQQATQAITIDIAAAALPYDVAEGDRLTAITLDPASGAIVARGASYKVNGPQPDGIARIVLRVVKMSSAAS